MTRAGPQGRPRGSLTLWLLIAICCIAGALLAGLLRITTRAARQLDTMIVTPAPSPAAAGSPLLALPALATPDARPTEAAGDAPITLLLLGADRRPGQEAIPRTDAMIVARIEPAAGRVALLSIPRDLWAPIPGHGSNRISNAYLWGERDGPPGAGMALARAAVGELLDLPIDYVALIDMQGFARMVDTVGGVTITVKEELIDTQFPTMDNGTTTIRFAPGPQRMDGTTALAYCRIRHPDSDFARSQRQQEVLVAIGERLRERGYLANLLAAEQITAALAGLVQTDLPRERMIDLAWTLRDLDADQIERYALDEDDVTFGIDADRFAQQARPGAIERLARQMIGEP